MKGCLGSPGIRAGSAIPLQYSLIIRNDTAEGCIICLLVIARRPGLVACVPLACGGLPTRALEPYYCTTGSPQSCSMSTLLFLLSIAMTGSRGDVACPLVKSVYPPAGTYINPSERLNFAVTIEFDEPMFLYSYKGRTLKLDLMASEAELIDIFRSPGNMFSGAALLLVTKDGKEEEINHRPTSVHSPGNNKVILVWEVGSMKEIIWKKYS